MSLALPPPVSPIAYRRFLLRLSQSDLADRAGVSRETISRLERGDQPRLQTARALAAALGADVATLFPDEESAPLANGTLSEISAAGDGRHVPAT